MNYIRSQEMCKVDFTHILTSICSLWSWQLSWEKQEDGSWKLHRNIFNANLMPAREEEPKGEDSGQ